ncbi:MAG: hypothetical protein IPO92_13620 [Saprospiraceae bacterium]|nr:hypothetical protein [Saprospiraceae bacterium]
MPKAGLFEALIPNNQAETDFISVQNVVLDYLQNEVTYVLNNTTKAMIKQAGEQKNTISGYARSLYHTYR